MATTRKKITIIKNSVAVFCCFAVIALISAYTWQVGSLISSKYETRSLEKEIQTLKTQNQYLKTEIANLQSIERINNFAELHGMVKNEKTVYLPVTISEFAIKH